MIVHTPNNLPTVIPFILLMKSLALSRRPYLSQIPMIPTVKAKRVAVLLPIKELPKVSKIPINVMEPSATATKPVAIPATTTVAIVSHLRAKPITTITTPINFNNSIELSPFNYFIHYINYSVYFSMCLLTFTHKNCNHGSCY